MYRNYLMTLVAWCTALLTFGQSDKNETYYHIETIPIPEGISMEVGGLAALPDGSLAAVTRRGEIWLISNYSGSSPHFRLFASGLHEPLGLAYTDGVFYTVQRGELTRISDQNRDGKADLFEKVYDWPLSGNYHEYSYGPVIDKEGWLWVTLNASWDSANRRAQSWAKWRGWVLKISKDGKMEPVATGLRSPAGFGFNAAGDFFYAENQGDWVGSGRISHVERGDFLGNPAGLKWTSEPNSPLKLKTDAISTTDKTLFETAQLIPELKSPAIWAPHGIFGISTSDILADTLSGDFGPFTGQLFVGDQGQSKIMRVALEKVNGQYQGAIFPFLDGFMSGILRMIWAKNGEMLVGMTNRGWNSTGRQPFGIQRVVWSGKTPFEMEKVEARPDGFEITFTQPLDTVTAFDKTAYQIQGFTYLYQLAYGSPVINQQNCPVQAVVLSQDRKRVRLVVENIKEGYIHELKIKGLLSFENKPLVHDLAYYTLNSIPEGEKIVVTSHHDAHLEHSSFLSSTRVSDNLLDKKIVEMPQEWNHKVDHTIEIGTKPGLKFSVEHVNVKAGARVQLIFKNSDDMLHNLVLVNPGRENEIGEKALELGLSGVERHYIPESDHILTHTSLLQPESEEVIYFQAPLKAGSYPYICTAPGHFQLMRGIMRVVE
jgi:glucose/arabinose dehydrogenase/azurin